MVSFELNDTKSKNSKRSLEPDISHISRGQFGSSQNSSTQRRVHFGLLVGRGNTNLASNEPLPPRIKESSLTKEAKSGGILSVKEMRKETKRKRMEEKSRDVPELEKMLKERLRWGDPMAHLVKRKTSELILEDFAENEKMKESGFMVPQTIPSHSWLKRGLDFHPNRYGIKPGRHWDGVDRSNGYEKGLFKRQNEKRATETEAYLWSVSDM